MNNKYRDIMRQYMKEEKKKRSFGASNSEIASLMKMCVFGERNKDLSWKSVDS